MRGTQGNVAGVGRLANDGGEQSRLERGRVETQASNGSEKSPNKDAGAIVTGVFHMPPSMIELVLVVRLTLRS